ncbi:hypothetical protein ACFL27_06570 [candidate division CSSED10-310 bacterium]|uniref:DUF488 domain-containing protein n=1 Tax=candidate division CSSED10-310 bacterium TaxID=2855610 RepID=A0ABV6YUU1_UNCC1
MIYTSYFAQTDKIKHPVSIARKSPKGFRGEQYRDLAPPWKIIMASKRGLITPEQYTVEYKKIISSLDVHTVARDLDGKTLLCWEKPGVFCHRHLVAAWLRDFGYQAEEVCF